MLRIWFVVVCGAVVASACSGDSRSDSPQVREAGHTESTAASFVVIVTDDQRADEIEASYMPELNARLIDRGTLFTQYRNNVALCCPGRATILTGRYAHNHKVLTNTNTGALDHPDRTIARWLDDAGYRTAYIGKYLNGYGCDGRRPRGWDDWRALCGERVQRPYGYSIRDGDAVETHGEAESDFQTDVLAELAVETIEDAAAAGEPFFVVVAPTPPHSLLHPAPRHEDLLPGYETPIRPNTNEPDVGDKPRHIRELPSDAAEDVRVNGVGRLRELAAVDDLVATIDDALARVSRRDEAYVVYTSDNGFLNREHRIQKGKNWLYEESLRVPFVVRGPGIPAGVTNDGFVANIDLAPTLAAIAGVRPGAPVDGVDFRPVLSDPRAFDDRVLLHMRRGQPDADGVTTGSRWRYVRWSTGEEELYDLDADPYELESLHDEVAYAEVKRQLAALVDELKTCAGTSCHLTHTTADGAAHG